MLNKLISTYSELERFKSMIMELEFIITPFYKKNGDGFEFKRAIGILGHGLDIVKQRQDGRKLSDVELEAFILASLCHLGDMYTGDDDSGSYYSRERLYYSGGFIMGSEFIREIVLDEECLMLAMVATVEQADSFGSNYTNFVAEVLASAILLPPIPRLIIYREIIISPNSTNKEIIGILKEKFTPNSLESFPTLYLDVYLDGMRNLYMYLRTIETSDIYEVREIINQQE